MLIIVIAAYIVFITMALMISARILWLIFFLFCYRFWESVISKQQFNHFIHFKTDYDYFIAIVLIAAATYFLIMFCTQNIQWLRYLFLLAVMICAVRVYSIADIMLFKDYLQAHGMWGTHFWGQQVKKASSVSTDGVAEAMQKALDNFWKIMIRFGNYIKAL